MVVVTINILVMRVRLDVMHHLVKRLVLLLPGGLVVSVDRLLLLPPRLIRLSQTYSIGFRICFCYFRNLIVVSERFLIFICTSTENFVGDVTK